MSKCIKLCTIELSNGETLGYREGGFGPQTIILIHGNLTSSKHWDILMEELIEQYKVYALDLRGFGLSTYNQPIVGLHDFAQDLHLFVQALNLKDFTLVGWSTGGGVSMDFVANYPDFASKLILLESVSVKGLKFYKKDLNAEGELNYFRTKEEMYEDEKQIKPVVAAQATGNKELFKKIWDSQIYVLKKPDPQRFEEYIEDSLTQRNHIDVYWALTTFNISSEHNGVTEGNNLAEKICLPTLIIQGEKDNIVPLADAIDIKNAIGENAELIIMENVGHSPLIDDLNGLIQLFINFIEK